ncbi:hypothetical protein IFR05_011799 [Cadophora sp. M221]|nr:hypothetical protein IFR05_011799 [Cadophora sp. M221]
MILDLVLSVRFGWVVLYCVTGLKGSLESIVSLLERQAAELREQHEGLDTHVSINDIMIKIGIVIDRMALKSLMEQVFAIHGEQLAK